RRLRLRGGVDESNFERRSAVLPLLQVERLEVDRKEHRVKQDGNAERVNDEPGAARIARQVGEPKRRRSRGGGLWLGRRLGRSRQLDRDRRSADSRRRLPEGRRRGQWRLEGGRSA